MKKTLPFLEELDMIEYFYLNLYVNIIHGPLLQGASSIMYLFNAIYHGEMVCFLDLLGNCLHDVIWVVCIFLDFVIYLYLIELPK